VQSFARAPLYDPSVLRTIFLRFEGTDWAQELAAFYNTDVDVPATAIVDGRTYRDVGVHFRGASSYRMVPEGAKKSLNLSFNFVNDEQRLLGYRTLNLLNGNGDPSLVRTLLYSEIARHYVPTPKTNYMRVVVNDESWGVYINAQQFNSDFTREFFSSTRGARWKVPGSPRGRAGMEYLGEDAASYRRLYEIKTKDDPKSWAALISMFRVLNQTPLARLEAELSPLLDIDGVLKFLAVEVALANSDGYWTRASDYSLYLDPQGRFHVIPHDVNEALSEESGFGFGFGGGGPMLDPLVALDDPTKPLRSRLLQVPALRQRYLGYVREIADVWLDWKKLEPLVRQYRALIAEDMKVDTHRLYSLEAFESGPASVKSFVDERRAFLLKRP
jgi:spore coat protein CotH